MIRIDNTTRDLRLSALKALLETGSGTAALKVYGTPMPASLATAAPTTALVVFNLPDPLPAISAYELVIPTSGGEVVLNSGTALWGRFFDGNGATVLDVDCGDVSSNAFIKLSVTTLYAGQLITAPTITFSD